MKTIDNKETFNQVNKSAPKRNREMVINSENRKDCLKALRTELKTSDRLRATKRIKKPTMAIVPDSDKNSDK